MNTIKYRKVGTAGLALNWTSVFLGRRKVGEIRPVPQGYQYVPTGASVATRMRGEVFETEAEVRRSLEAE